MPEQCNEAERQSRAARSSGQNWPVEANENPEAQAELISELLIYYYD